MTGKLVMALCAASVAGICLAADATSSVSSANVVGYNITPITKGRFVMIGCQYGAPGAGSIAIQDFIKGDFSGVEYGDGSAFLTTAPQIQAWNPNINNYDFYYYLLDAFIDDNNTPEGWADLNGNYVTDTITSGLAAWFMNPNEDCNVTVAGEILSTDSTVTVPKNLFSMCAVPYPVSYEVNSANITWSGIGGVEYGDGSAFLTTAPQIQAWNPNINNYDFYYYLLDAFIDDNNTPEGWADLNGNYVTDTFPVGYAFWIKPTSQVTISFNSPLN